MTDEALSTFVEIFREANFRLDDLLEDFKRVVMHKGTCTNEHFVNENPQTVPVYRLAMPLIHNDFRSKIFRSPTDSVSPFSVSNSLDKSEI